MLGKLSAYVSGDFSMWHGSDTHSTVTDESTRDVYEVASEKFLTPEAKAQFHQNEDAFVTGKIVRNQFLLTDALKPAGPAFTIKKSDSLQPTIKKNGAAPTTVVKNIIMIPVSFSDAYNGYDTSDMDNEIIQRGRNTVNDTYIDMSHGKFSFTGVSTPKVTIAASQSGGCSEIYTWLNQANDAVTALGYNPYAYDLRVYSFVGGCGNRGLGSTGWAASFVYHDTFTWAHEMGHGLGMHHASNLAAEYGDPSDFMGYGGGYTHLAAPHQVHLGLKVPAQIAAGTYTIPPLEVASETATAPQILKLIKPDSGENNYLSYRQPIGIDANLEPAFLGGLSIHRWSGIYFTQTVLVTTLADGQTYTDDVNNYTITQLSHNSSGVQIRVDAGCIKQNPSATISPNTQAIASGATASYTITLTNNDSSACAATSFDLSSQLTQTLAGYTKTLSKMNASLASGQSTTAILSVQSAAGSNTFLSGSVTASDSTDRARTTTVSATLTVGTGSTDPGGGGPKEPVPPVVTPPVTTPPVTPPVTTPVTPPTTTPVTPPAVPVISVDTIQMTFMTGGS